MVMGDCTVPDQPWFQEDKTCLSSAFVTELFRLKTVETRFCHPAERRKLVPKPAVAGSNPKVVAK
jgi:hypothetical protein